MHKLQCPIPGLVSFHPNRVKYVPFDWENSIEGDYWIIYQHLCLLEMAPNVGSTFKVKLDNVLSTKRTEYF